MTHVIPEPTSDALLVPTSRQSLIRTVLSDRLALVGLLLVACTLILVALLAPWLAPYPAQGRGAARRRRREPFP